VAAYEMKRFVVSKWRKTAELLKDNELRAHIPKTVLLTKDSLLSMLHEFQMVYIKPDKGTFGNGVMRVEWNPAVTNSFQYQLGEKARSFKNYDSLYQDIARKTKKKMYLVQKGIHLLKYHKRRFDIRIMVQKNLQKEWETTGWIGRVAHPKKIVTNYHSGGKLMPVEHLLKGRLKEPEKKLFYKQFKKLGTRVAKQLHKRYPDIKEIGIDVALDEAIMPLILEVNTKPDPYIFRSLANKAIFGKIISYKRANRKV
jgi:glutathione synthase/RimK-type ligase-like ATP-grasp enzyme